MKTDIEILAEELIKYHKQIMTIDDQIERIHIADSEKSNILIGHTFALAAMKMVREELKPYLSHLDNCNIVDMHLTLLVPDMAIDEEYESVRVKCTCGLEERK